MPELSPLSQLCLYTLLALMGIFTLIVWGCQVMILRGKTFKNPDGSVDDWHEQKTHYGIAFADIFLACPVNILGIVFILLGSRWGYFLLTLASFWWVWANVMTTATSLRFHHPRVNLMWFIAFPFGGLLGIAYIIWTLLHFDLIF